MGWRKGNSVTGLKHLKGITIMTTITNENISAFSAGEVPDSNNEKNDLDYLKAMKNHSMMGGAMVTMEEMMLMFTELAQGKFKQMQDKTAVGRDATDLANRVEGIIAKLKDGDSMDHLPKDVIEYMQKNNILVGGKSIDEYMKSISWHANLQGNVTERQKEVGVCKANVAKASTPKELEAAEKQLEAAQKRLNAIQLLKSELEEVKGALESTATRATDFVQSSQLKLQQLMQSFNTAVAMANAVQSMNGESTKSIAQSIR
jgi:secreted effector protein SseB